MADARNYDEVIAAFLLDRADQYDTDSPCWVALADAAEEVAGGEAIARYGHGELDPELFDRLRTMIRARKAERGR